MLFSYSSACLREWVSASLSIWFSSVSSLTAKACLWLVISKWVCEKFASSDWLRYSTMELSRFLCISFPSLYNVSATLLARLLSCCICWRRDSVFPSSPWRWCTSSLYSSWISRPRAWIRLAPCSASAPRRSSSSMRIVAPSSSLEANINSAWYSVTSFVEYINRLLRVLISLNTCWLCPRRFSVNLVSMSLMTWSLEAAYISDCTTFSLKVWHCSLRYDSYWFTATTCFCWSSFGTNVTWLPTRFVLDCPRGPMFGRCPPRWSVASSCVSTSCHVTGRSRSTGGWCSSVSRSHLLPSRFCRPCGLVPAVSCPWRRLWDTFCRGCGITVKGELRFSAVALHLCDAGADRISRSFAPDAG